MCGVVSKFIAHMTMNIAMATDWIRLCHATIYKEIFVAWFPDLTCNTVPHCHYVVEYTSCNSLARDTWTLCKSTNVMHTYCTGQQLLSNVVFLQVGWRLPDSKNLPLSPPVQHKRVQREKILGENNSWNFMIVQTDKEGKMFTKNYPCNF